jgi:hypothetical protein
MTDSILNTTKKALGLDESYTAFDPEIIMHINSVFSTLNQLGVGPELGFQITDASQEWTTFLEDDFRLNNVKTYMYLRVRLLWDPPTTSYTITAFDSQVKELEWRILTYKEQVNWTDPDPDLDEEIL